MSELTDDLAAVRTLQEGDGCYTITIPKDLVRDLALEPGDGIFFSGREGDDTFRAGDANALLNDARSADD